MLEPMDVSNLHHEHARHRARRQITRIGLTYKIEGYTDYVRTHGRV